MQTQNPLLTRKRFGLFVMLVTLLASVYMLTYSGRIESGDTLQFFDALNSAIRYGDLELDESFWFSTPDDIRANSDFPSFKLQVPEQLHLHLATPLYYLANTLPDLGYVHSVWLFNVIVSALVGGALFWLVLAWGYQETVAVWVVLLGGILTIILPYSKTFFREPLAALLLLLATLFLHLWRTHGYFRKRWSFLYLLFGLLAIAGASQTKASTFFALPMLVLIVLPEFKQITQWRYFRRGMGILLALAILLFVVVISSNVIFDALLQIVTPITSALGTETGFIQHALRTYWLSIGGSFWGTSPIVLLAMVGLVLLYRQGRLRLMGCILVLIVGYTVGHAVSTGVHWFGGVAWPPRFLVPTIPFLMLGIAPLLEYLLKHRQKWLFAIVIIVGLYSAWVQFNAVALQWDRYANVLPLQAQGLFEWSRGLYEVAYLRWVTLPSLWGPLGFDFAWLRVGLPLWALGYVLLIVLCSMAIWILLKQELIPSSRFRFFTKRRVWIALPIVWAAITLFGLRALHKLDTTYWAHKPALFDVLDVMEQEGRADDLLLLADNTYERFMLNHNDVLYPRVLVLQPQPGEKPSETQDAQVVSDHVGDLLTSTTSRLIHLQATERDRLWLLAHTSPFIEWSVRPVERFLATYYYLLAEMPLETADPTVRLLLYDLSEVAPDPAGYRGPEHETDLTFGDAIRLAGFTLPAGREYQTGDSVPISLYWIADDVPERDYTVTWFVADALSGQVVAQGMDSAPMAGFLPTSTWRAGVPVWDNRSVVLPYGLPSGDYELWVVLYYFDGEIVRLPVMGETVREDTIGVLPVRIRVNGTD